MGWGGKRSDMLTAGLGCRDVRIKVYYHQHRLQATLPLAFRQSLYGNFPQSSLWFRLFQFFPSGKFSGAKIPCPRSIAESRSITPLAQPGQGVQVVSVA